MFGLKFYITIILISLITCDVEVKFIVGVQRLNHSTLWDNYFRCLSNGKTLQWELNNNNLSDYSGSRTGDIFNGTIASCRYTATLLSLKSGTQGNSLFDSVMIVSCQGNPDLNVVCRNGFLSSATSNLENAAMDVIKERSSDSVFMQYVFIESILQMDKCISVFICGVNNTFMTWQVNSTDYQQFPITILSPLGFKRIMLQDSQSVVKQEAIRIDLVPYNIVSAFFLVDMSELIVTCGYAGDSISLSTIDCSNTKKTTEISSSANTFSIGDSSTITSGGDNNISLKVGLSVPLVAVFVVAVIIIIILGCLCYKKRFKDEQGSEKPLKDINFKRIKMPNILRRNNIDNNFLEQVEYIFLTRNKHTFDAARTILTAPNIVNTSHRLTSITEGVYIARIGSHPVCLVNDIDNHFIENLKNIIKQHFSNAKYLVFVGRCFGIDRNKIKLADIVISKSIYHITHDSSGNHANTKLIAPEIRGKFCFYPERNERLEVSKCRRANYLVGKIASGVNILDNQNLRNFANDDEISAIEETSGELLSLFENGIIMENNTTKHMQVITIGAVTGYVDENNTVEEFDEWQNIASQAAFHYIASAMIYSQNSKDISYKIKKPKQRRDNIDYEVFCNKVQYTLLTMHQDEFDAATTTILAPDIEEESYGITEIDTGVYIGMIESHPVGLFQFHGNILENLKRDIKKYFPNIKYLIRAGGCRSLNLEKAELADVLISNEIDEINCENYDVYLCKSMTSEIKDIFCNNQYQAKCLQMPDGRSVRHLVVKIASTTNSPNLKQMKELATINPGICGFEPIGGDLLRLAELLSIHVIIICGIFCIGSSEYNEWHFVASQAAFNYVANKMNKIALNKV